MRIINTTNVCVAQCDYCAFYALPGQPGGYVLTEEQIFAKGSARANIERLYDLKRKITLLKHAVAPLMEATLVK